MQLAAVLCFAVLAAVVAADHLSPDVVPVLQREETRDADGQYVLNYLTGDGTSVSEQGALKPGPEGNVLVKQGTIRYTSPEGQTIVLSYYADDTGFHPTGEHLPVAPVDPHTHA